VETTKLSSKGQVIIPKHMRDLLHWKAGLELQVIELAEGILLKPKAPFEPSTLGEVAGCLRYQGKTKTTDDIECAMKRAAREAWCDGG